MPTLSKDTGVRISIGLLLFMVVWMLGASWRVFGYVQAIERNTEVIQNVVLSLELSRIDRLVSALKERIRDMNRRIRAEPGNELLLSQLDELTDELAGKLLIRDCIEDPAKRVCE